MDKLFYKELIAYLLEIKADYLQEIKDLKAVAKEKPSEQLFVAHYEFALQELLVTMARIKSIGFKYGLETNNKKPTVH